MILIPVPVTASILRAGEGRWTVIKGGLKTLAPTDIDFRPSRGAVRVPNGTESLLTLRWRAGGEWIRTSGSAMRSHRQQRGPGRAA